MRTRISGDSRTNCWSRFLIQMSQPEQLHRHPLYRVPPRDELRSLLRDHQQWLQTAHREGAQATLEEFDLRDSDLSGFRLEHVVFKNVCLQGRTFQGVNLTGCWFINADMIGATLSQVDLTQAQFKSKTDLSDAIIAPTDLNKTEFSDVVLNNTEFQIRMDAAPEHACQFHSCKCSGTLFKDAILNNVEFKSNYFDSANFKGANLKRVTFRHGIYTRCDFSGVLFETPTSITHVSFLGSSFEGAVFWENSGIEHCNFAEDGDEPCSFRKADLGGVRLEDSTFRKVDFESANLNEAILRGIAVDGSNFTASSGLYGRHKATLERVKGAQNARYTHRYDYCTWSRVRTIGSIPLFGVSYFAVIAIILLVSLTKTYNLQVDAFKQKIESTSAPANNSAIEQNEQPDDGESRSGSTLETDRVSPTFSDGQQRPAPRVVTPLWTDKLQEIKLPGTLMRTLGALCLLAIGSTVYRVFCPHEIQENTRVKWVRELDSPEIEYRALAVKGMPWRWISGVCLSIGAAYLLYHIICRVADTLEFLWSHAS